MSGVKFDTAKLAVNNDINKVVAESDVLIFCIPSKFMNSVVDSITCDCSQKLIVSAIKGIVSGENRLLSEYLSSKLNVPFNNVAVLSGPCHAEEVAMERLSYLTIGSKIQQFAEFVADLVRCHYIKTTVSEDVFGIELPEDIKSAMSEIDITPAVLSHGNKLMQLTLPDHTLAVMVKRDGHYFIPKGNTELKENDKLLMISDNDEALLQAYDSLGVKNYTMKKN